MSAISIIIIADGYANALEKNLPGVLAQQYAPGFEVIVVRESKKGETIDVLKPLMSQHGNLSTTYIPDKPQYITENEVAIMLGVRAAKHEQLLIIHPTFEVPSSDWLTELSSSLTAPISLGTPHFSRKHGVFKKLFHKRKTLKFLKPWLSERGIEKASLSLPKDIRHNLSVAFKRQEYLDEDLFRHFIYLYTNP